MKWLGVGVLVCCFVSFATYIFFNKKRNGEAEECVNIIYDMVKITKLSMFTDNKDKRMLFQEVERSLQDFEKRRKKINFKSSEKIAKILKDLHENSRPIK